MPRSRSSGFESITRSSTCWLARKAPAWRSIWSTSVVLPWSTWAMIAMFRITQRSVLTGLRDKTAYGPAPGLRGGIYRRGVPGRKSGTRAGGGSWQAVSRGKEEVAGEQCAVSAQCVRVSRAADRWGCGLGAAGSGRLRAPVLTSS